MIKVNHMLNIVKALYLMRIHHTSRIFIEIYNNYKNFICCEFISQLRFVWKSVRFTKIQRLEGAIMTIDS